MFLSSASRGALAGRHALVAALWGCGIVSALVIAAILAFILGEAVPVLRHVGATAFVTDASWHPASGQFNLLPMLAGTVLVSLGAMLIAGPVGFISAIFCQFYAPPWIAASYRRVLYVIVGVPSVVYGLWGLVVLVPLIGSIEPPGASLLAGMLVLSIMILPTVAVIADTSLGQVPGHIFRGGLALGVPMHRVVLRIVLPAARAGLFTALVLAAGRALGETMAVLMVTGNAVQMPASLFDPIRSLAANIALEMSYAMGDHRSALFVSGVILTAIVAAATVLADRLSPAETHHED